MGIVKYIILAISFGFIAFFTLAILFHPHTTPLSNETIEMLYAPILIIAFIFVFILPVIILNKGNKKEINHGNYDS